MYIKNFMTDRPYTQPNYMDVNGVEFVKTMRTLKEQGKLNSVQERFLSDFRPSEELYDIVNDPFELKKQPLPRPKVKGLGDAVSLVAHPIAKAIDTVFGTSVSSCGGCAKRQQSLNEILPFENKQDT